MLEGRRYLDLATAGSASLVPSELGSSEFGLSEFGLSDRVESERLPFMPAIEGGSDGGLATSSVVESEDVSEEVDSDGCCSKSINRRTVVESSFPRR